MKISYVHFKDVCMAVFLLCKTSGLAWYTTACVSLLKSLYQLYSK